MQSALEERENVRTQPARAGADLKDAQAPPFRELASRTLDRGPDRSEPVAGVTAVAVELVEEFRPGACEENLHRVLLTTKDRAKFCATRGTKESFGEMSRVTRN